MTTLIDNIVETKNVQLFCETNPLEMDCGEKLSPVTVAYETYGELNAAGDNAILVCHALTGSAHAAGYLSSDPKSAGWWDSFIGDGKAIDTRKYFVVCSNFLGGCYGTTGPVSLSPITGRPYGTSFPQMTIRDMVRVQKALIDFLGVKQVRTVIGGSLGGMQALEWGVMSCPVDHSDSNGKRTLAMVHRSERYCAPGDHERSWVAQRRLLRPRPAGTGIVARTPGCDGLISQRRVVS